MLDIIDSAFHLALKVNRKEVAKTVSSFSDMSQEEVYVMIGGIEDDVVEDVGDDWSKYEEFLARMKMQSEFSKRAQTMVKAINEEEEDES